MIGREAALLFQRYAAQTADDLADVAALDGELGAAVAAVQKERAEVATGLAAVYLPELTEPALAIAQARTGFRGFTQRKPLDAMVREEKQLRARVATLEVDERWVKRNALAGPQGSITRSLAEARDLLEPWDRDCQRFESLEGFRELVEIGYDTPAFAERWWQPTYWRHWAAGDRICAALGLADFGDDVLPAWNAAREPRDRWRAEVDRFEAALAAVHAHVRERDEAAWRLENLATIYLDECRRVLAEHLLRADVQLLATWAGDDRGVTVVLKRFSGLAAKIEMLSEMQLRWLRPSRGALEETRRKFEQKASKLARPKKAGVPVVMPADVPAKLEAQRQRRTKARATLRRIVHYDAYDRFDLAQPPEIWYLHIHDHHRPGPFTPGFRDWYDHHPDVTALADPAWDRGDPLAAVGNLVDRGDLS
jgi:hypothetical protein